jgi:1L-myo-inositol 1-phosphate cytidylyltransferase
MSTVSEAVILVAGQGSRLRDPEKHFLKPFAPVLGRPLISYTLDLLACAGIERLYLVVGYQSEQMITQLQQLIGSRICTSYIENRDWRKQNGISLLAAAGHVRGPFLLTMADHLFENAIVDRLLDSFDPQLLNMAVDRKLDQVFDLDDAMKVQIRRNKVIAIGKDLQRYNAIDTGLFICPLEIFDYLKRSKRNGDCSLADGARSMAADGKVRAIDIGQGWWQDVDTLDMLWHAEEKMRASATQENQVEPASYRTGS